MTETNNLKLLAEAVANVDWAWWTSNSRLRLTSEIDGRHGADGDVISAHGDTLICPQGFRAFIEEASPANIAALIAENEKLLKIISDRATSCSSMDATETVDYDYRTDLAAYFGLSYASWLTLPRVLMEAMPEVWMRQMAALLHQYDDAFPNQPNYGTTVRLTVDGKLVKTPGWLSNYRHPDLAMINQLRGQVPAPSSEGSTDAY